MRITTVGTVNMLNKLFHLNMFLNPWPESEVNVLKFYE